MLVVGRQQLDPPAPEREPVVEGAGRDRPLHRDDRGRQRQAHERDPQQPLHGSLRSFSGLRWTSIATILPSSIGEAHDGRLAVGAERQPARHAVDVDELGVAARLDALAPERLRHPRDAVGADDRLARRGDDAAAVGREDDVGVQELHERRRCRPRPPARPNASTTLALLLGGRREARPPRLDRLARPRRELPRRRGRGLQRRRDLVERVAEDVVQDERDPLVGRQALEHDQQRERDVLGLHARAPPGSGSAPPRSARAATARRTPRAAPARSAARPAPAATPSSSASPAGRGPRRRRCAPGAATRPAPRPRPRPRCRGSRRRAAPAAAGRPRSARRASRRS